MEGGLRHRGRPTARQAALRAPAGSQAARKLALEKRYRCESTTGHYPYGVLGQAYPPYCGRAGLAARTVLFMLCKASAHASQCCSAAEPDTEGLSARSVEG